MLFLPRVVELGLSDNMYGHLSQQGHLENIQGYLLTQLLAVLLKQTEIFRQKSKPGGFLCLRSIKRGTTHTRSILEQASLSLGLE